MTIQFNTDKNVSGSDKLTTTYTNQIEDELTRFRDNITRIEVHLSDEDGNKNGQSTMRCMLEARIEGRQPLAVTDQAETLDQAVYGALDKLTSVLTKIQDKSN